MKKDARLCVTWRKHTLLFAFEARTSRGMLPERTVWFVCIQEQNAIGWGECAPLLGLSQESAATVETQLNQLGNTLQTFDTAKEAYAAKEWQTRLCPSVRLGVEMALQDLIHGGKRILFADNSFIHGKARPINGLIWMDSWERMRQNMYDKVAAGHRCLKFKVGALDFDAECNLLAEARKQWGNAITIRLDANGSFDPQDAEEKLSRLAAFEPHSIEQPLGAHEHKALEQLSNHSPVPIALDESLIGVPPLPSGRTLLKRIAPQYIVLKPSLLGGFAITRQWIQLAEELRIGWWITSALESHVGLNALAQFSATLQRCQHQVLPEGLGTGALYRNDVHSPLEIKGNKLYYNLHTPWPTQIT